MPGPLLLTSGTEDHTVPLKVTKEVFSLYSKGPSDTDFHEFEGRGHSLTIDHGWKDVADTALQRLSSKGTLVTAPDPTVCCPRLVCWVRYICGDVAIHITGTWTDEYSVAPRHRRTRCSGLRNCNVNPDDLRPDRPDLDCEPQQARGIPRNVQMDETLRLL